MNQKMFAVFDLKMKMFLQPFFSGEPGSAMRAFGDEVVKAGSPFQLHPEDYQLFEVGVFDSRSGKLEGIHPCKLLCIGVDFVLAKEAK